MRVAEIEKESHGVRELFVNNEPEEIRADLLAYALLICAVGSESERRAIMAGLESLRKHNKN